MNQDENFLFKDHNEPLRAEQVGPNLYRLLECPVFTEEVRYGDVVEAERQADSSLLFRRVAQPSTYRTWTWVLSRDLVDSADILELCEMVRSRGGHWQRDFGGLLQLVLPLGADLDPDAWYENRRHPENEADPPTGLWKTHVDDSVDF